MKHSRQVKVDAPPDIVFEQARAIAASTEATDAVEAKANSYVRYTVQDGKVGVDYRFTPDEGGTLIDCTATMRYGAGEAWAGGIFTPLLAPGFYFMLRRMGRSLTEGLKVGAERKALSAGQKRKVQS